MIHKVVDIITKESPHLDWMQDRTILLVRHGSCAYGELELQDLYKTTTLLPRSPNLKKLDPLCISIIEQSFK